MLELADDLAVAIKQVNGQGIAASLGRAVRIAIPPVTNGDVRRTTRHGEVLSDAVIATAIATEVGTVVAAMWIG